MEMIKCNSITISQRIESGLFDGPYSVNLCLDDTIIRVYQCCERKTEIISENEVAFSELFSIFNKLDRLLMIFDGEFYPISSISYKKSGKSIPIDKDKILSKRISAYNSAPLIKGSVNSLASPFKFVCTDLFKKWSVLEDELEIVHQIYLYNLSDTGFPVDGRIAFMIECFEPLSELLDESESSSSKPKGKKPSLKSHLEKVISKYGNDIFSEEYSGSNNKFLSILVNSRVKIMHIKRKAKATKMVFTGSESVLYIWKLSLLYRRIILDLLNINYSDYRKQLNKSVKIYNSWKDNNGVVLEGFLNKLAAHP